MAATAAVLLASAHCAPPAFAVVPPAIDNSLLPPPAPAAPTQPTEQREPCAVPVPVTGVDVSATQLAGFDMPEIWRLTRGAGQRVAVIDTGIAAHRRLSDVVAGGDYVSSGDGRQDCDGHGTAVAGIIAAAPDRTDRTGFTGMAPEATLIAIRQSSNKFSSSVDPASSGFGDVYSLAMAVRTAADMGASVINISSVACTEEMLEDRALGAALSYAVDVKDVVVVAAAGNVGGEGQCPAQNTAVPPTVIASPAWYDDYVLTVASLDSSGTPSAFSLRGPWVDVAAPGEHVVSLDPDGVGVIDTMPTPAGQAPMSGTSYATPVVSGLVALVRSRFPRLSARQVMMRIEATAHHPPGGWNATSGNGVIDPMAALSDQTTASSPPSPRPSAALQPTDPAPHRPYAVAATSAALCVAGLIAAASARLGRRHEDVPPD
ncbi:type VII secretion-associated serine protease mycosin [Mycobacterium sp. CVI_P3]|uniref:Type VII secretion-associated serine protease mycosin n=1 Tax=Mycobacterium pinniadriaticum TaxID=2994102 RepID=A0ABT3SEY2_9MYCO|nr:type VII secretion-associated serine protease mycosin [Mycobacterium pinniadriaticum]MCX2937693.1 type VII secretion-associated serine protease mycosin [Mycobacterium pinniadriaticum]